MEALWKPGVVRRAVQNSPWQFCSRLKQAAKLLRLCEKGVGQRLGPGHDLVNGPAGSFSSPLLLLP